jgi:hypothetical protein
MYVSADRSLGRVASVGNHARKYVCTYSVPTYLSASRSLCCFAFLLKNEVCLCCKMSCNAALSSFARLSVVLNICMTTQFAHVFRILCKSHAHEACAHVHRICADKFAPHARLSSKSCRDTGASSHELVRTYVCMHAICVSVCIYVCMYVIARTLGSQVHELL